MNKIFLWQDPLSWPKDWPHFKCEPDDPVLESYREQLRLDYSAIRCFHGVRTSDIESYFTSGLKINDSNTLISKLKSLFDIEIFQTFSECEIDQAIITVGNSDQDKSYLTLDHRNLTENSGHYLIYGSEFILNVATELLKDQIFKFHDYLKTIGKPTILEIDLPINYVSSNELNQLSWNIISTHPKNKTSPIIDFTIVLHKSLHNEFIIGHQHPKRIMDYHNGGDYYYWKKPEGT